MAASAGANRPNQHPAAPALSPARAPYQLMHHSERHAREETVMMETLVEKTCVPCRGGIPPLPRAEAERYLLETPEWSLVDDGRRIERTFEFDDFATALTFVNQVGALAEAESHHPDISFGWGACTVSWYTHKIKGLHENDFIMAAKVDALPVR
jgi:4a-hydroxytetrahydrobiopterin dehydratase